MRVVNRIITFLHLPPLPQADERAVLDAASEQEGWGWLPALSVIASLGLLLVVLAYNGARDGASYSAALRWVGIIVVFMPIAARLFMPSAPRKERMGLIVLLGMLLYLVKVLYSPLEFKFSDEFQHWRSTANILESSHLFEYNFILPISPRYPGVQNLTTALIRLSDLSIFDAGIYAIGAGRLVLSLGLFLFYERVGKSTYIAGIAAMLYMTNPHFQFQNAMFTYSAMALGLSGLVFGLAALWARAETYRRSYLVMLLLAIPTVVVTHHITTYVVSAFLLSWMVIALVLRRHDPDQVVPVVPAILAVALTVYWIAAIAPTTTDYLAPSITKAVSGLSEFLLREGTTEETFHAPASPLIERLLNMASVGLIAGALPFSIWFTWRRYRRDALTLTLGLGAFAYFGSITVRVVTSEGAELAGRSWPFVFMPTAFVLAVAAVEMWQWLRWNWILTVAAPLFAFAVFIGGIMGGWPPYWERLPGPYEVSASELSIEPESVTTAQWAREYLGKKNRIAADLTNHLLMGAYGEQYSNYGLASVYTAPEIGPKQLETLNYYEIRYLLVDKRISQGLPVRGYYFNAREPNAYNYHEPIPLAALEKFDQQPQASRIFDSGDIVIYDVSALSRLPGAAAAP